MKHTIIAPVSEFTGVVAGVHFADGKAETDSENAVAYFLRQGYTVEPASSETESNEPPSDPSGKPDGDSSADDKSGRARPRSKPKEE
ncbi:hypothetical protein [Streptomyces smyrnaeus]|uniref:hypothetical protein n=1 Tax=Streptomyces smyrnaeus TaxID=1387713 RepID=UPI00369324D3